MKKIYVWILNLALILTSCAFPQQTTATSKPDPLATAWEDRALFKSGLIQSQQSTLDQLKGASVYHLEFSIPDEIDHITGHEAVQYTNTETVPLKEIQFRLFPNILGGSMDVTNISIDDQSVTANYQLEKSLMSLPLSTPLEPGQSAVIKMDFEVTVPHEVQQNYGVFAYSDDVLALAHSYPMTCVYDDEGWNAEIPSPNGDVTYADESFFIVKVTAPKGLTLVTTGREIQHDEGQQTQTLYVANGPARDFYLVASPNYKKVSKTFGEVTINSYAKEGMEEGAQIALDVASKAIEIYDKRYAPFPYTEFDIVSTPTLALGIEYPGMIAITSRIYDVGADFRGTPVRNYMEATVAHEVGHQWFYSLVGDDQLDDPWLDESLAQFATLQYYTDEYGPQGAQGFRDSLEARWKSVNSANIPIGLPVAKYTGQEYGAIVYGRGALFFVALREEMGTEKFDSFMKDYTKTLSWGIATPELLQSLAEKDCACDLDQMFKDWVYP